MRNLFMLLYLLLAFTVSAEDLGKTYADQGWAMWDRIDQNNTIEGDSYEKIIDLFNQAVTYGNKEVYNGMGYLYQHRWVRYMGPTEKCRDMIEDYYNKAIANGSTMAIYNLGTCYLEGDSYIGFEKNFNKALAMFKMGAEQGNAYCLNQLGLFYKNRDVPSSGKYPEVAAFECFSKAYEKQPVNCPAICNLAECYEKGEGVTRDEPKAFALYLDGSKYDDYSAAKVALFYEEGRVVEKDLEKAYEYYSKATANQWMEEWIMQHYYHVAKLLGKEDSEYIDIETVSPAVR